MEASWPLTEAPLHFERLHRASSMDDVAFTESRIPVAGANVVDINQVLVPLGGNLESASSERLDWEDGVGHARVLRPLKVVSGKFTIDRDGYPPHGA